MKKKQHWMRIECRGNFPCEVWEISFVSRVFTKKTRVRIPCCCFFLLLQIFLHNQEKIKIGYNSVRFPYLEFSPNAMECNSGWKIQSCKVEDCEATAEV